MRNVEELIKKGMEKKGLNRVQLAKKVGVSEGAIRKWEKEGIENAKLTSVKKICEVLDLDTMELLGLKPISTLPEQRAIARKINNIKDTEQLNKINSIIDIVKGDEE